MESGDAKSLGAAAATDPDYYWLANDDTVMESEALAMLLAMLPKPGVRVIAVGAVTDPRSGRQVYGGWRKRGRERVEAKGRVEECTTMNANCALVPRAVFQEMGMFHGAFTHAMGDFDYGLEAGRHGIALRQTASAVAHCEENSERGTWRDRTLNRSERWAKVLSPKGLPPKEWWIYTRRNEGWLGVLRFISPYLKIWMGR
ncbi:MAG: glycosyltransferase family 2 protein [Blastochloris sp.]|nr:glycosyltransferase family 2 protein [Blastochloris sp.]